MIESVIYLPNPSPAMTKIREAIQVAGYHLHKAETLEQALEEIERGDVHLLIWLGEENSKHAQFCRNLQKNCPAFPILKISESLLTHPNFGKVILQRARRLIYTGNLKR